VTRSVWKLDGTTAEFDDGRLRARVDLLEPQAGIVASHFSGRSIGGYTLGVGIGKVAADDLSLPETYARVDDLVATYLQTEVRPFRLQAYWRRVDASRLPGLRDASVIELQVSINTSLLDTHPSVPVACGIAGARGTVDRDGRRYQTVETAEGFTYFEAVHPSDDRGAQGEPLFDGFGAGHVLFGEFLEKGVIVRSRIRAAFLPGGATAADCDALYDALVSEPLPLTT
jgi:hypothetical protein